MRMRVHVLVLVLVLSGSLDLVANRRVHSDEYGRGNWSTRLFGESGPTAVMG